MRLAYASRGANRETAEWGHPHGRLHFFYAGRGDEAGSTSLWAHGRSGHWSPPCPRSQEDAKKAALRVVLALLASAAQDLACQNPSVSAVPDQPIKSRPILYVDLGEAAPI